MLAEVFDRFGIKKIDALGAQFDPTLHEAVMEIEDYSHLPGRVGRVIEEGYSIHDRLLRPARVAVVKSPANKAARQAEGDSRTATENDRGSHSGHCGR